MSINTLHYGDDDDDDEDDNNNKVICRNRSNTITNRHKHVSASSRFSIVPHTSVQLVHTGLFEMIVGVLTTCHTQYT